MEACAWAGVESSMAENKGVVQSSRASDLPTEAGMAWQHTDDEGGWINDANIEAKAEYEGPLVYPEKVGSHDGDGR